MIAKARGQAIFSNEDFLLTYNTKMIKGKKGLCKTYGVNLKRDLAKKVFSYALKCALEDVINGDVEVKLLNNREVYLRMNPKEGERLKDSIARGNWKNVDMLKAGFKVWYPSIDVVDGKFRRVIYQVCVQQEYKDIVESKINEGFRYS